MQQSWGWYYLKGFFFSDPVPRLGERELWLPEGPRGARVIGGILIPVSPFRVACSDPPQPPPFSLQRRQTSVQVI